MLTCAKPLIFPQGEEKFSKILGFNLDMKSGKLSFLLDKGDSELSQVFTNADINFALENKIGDVYFSLD